MATAVDRSVSEPEFAAIVAFDWGNDKHVWAAQDAESGTRTRGELACVPHACLGSATPWSRADSRASESVRVAFRISGLRRRSRTMFSELNTQPACAPVNASCHFLTL